MTKPGSIYRRFAVLILVGITTTVGAGEYGDVVTIPSGSTRHPAGHGRPTMTGTVTWSAPHASTLLDWPGEVRRLPPVQPSSNAGRIPEGAMGATPGEPVDRTCREDGRHIIINLNGQQLRLEKSGAAPTAAAPTAAAPTEQANGGEVYGRLSHRGQPVVNCAVALLPLSKTWNSYEINEAVEPLVARTDEHGDYHFAAAPPGPYKLSWLPAGERQWIRRVEFRPDVRVRAGETAHIEEIRVALRTIN